MEPRRGVKGAHDHFRGEMAESPGMIARIQGCVHSKIRLRGLKCSATQGPRVEIQGLEGLGFGAWVEGLGFRV